MPDSPMTTATMPPPIVGEAMTIDEIEERFAGEWILMRISGYDEDNCPERGYLLDRASTQEEILNAWTRRVPLLKDGNGWPLYSFLAGTLIKDGPEVQAAVMEFFGGLLQAGTKRDVRFR